MDASGKQKQIINRMIPEVLLKDVLEMPVEHLHNYNVFQIDEDWKAAELKKSHKVRYAQNIAEFREVLEKQADLYIMVSMNLVNRPLLEKILAEFSGDQNILWANI